MKLQNRVYATCALVMLCAFTPAQQTFAQVDTTKAPPGIALTGRYSATDRPAVAVRPFAGVGATASIVDSMTAIVLRDITQSDRYEMVTTPSTLLSGGVDYRAWTGIGTSYLITGDVVPTAAGYELTLTVHDVVYSRVKDTHRYRIPAATAQDFRLALHTASDEAARVISGTPGSAATRIVFERQNKATTANATGSYDLLVVDADGFGLRRILGNVGQLYSPAWSPDGKKILYVLNNTQIIERDVQSGASRVLLSDTGVQTPTYSPDGMHILYTAWVSKSADIFEYDIARGCCKKRITDGAIDIGATYSSDGKRIAFMSNRLGQPMIYTMSADGSGASLMSPYVPNLKGYYFGPDWSPTGSEVVFAGHWNAQGVFQIMLGDANRAGGQVHQLTTGGDNEDPTWSPDGRHIAFSSGVGDQQLSLYVIDALTQTKRKIADGGKLRMADWSPLLARAADYTVR